MRFDATRLRDVRLAQGLTQEGLARQVDVTLRTVQRWEDGESDPQGAPLLSLCRALGVDAESLYGPADDTERAA